MSDPYLRHLSEAAGDPVRWAFLVGVQLLQAGRASLLLRPGNSQVFNLAASVGIEASVSESIQVEIGQGIAGMVGDRGMELFGSADDTTFMSVPIVMPRGIMGVFNVTDRIDGRQYTEGDMAVARAVADHIASLLEYGSYEAHDPVSRLPNRQSYEEALERELARSKRSGSCCTVGMIVLEGLADLTSETQSAEVNRLVRLFADECKRRVRRYDVIARLSEDTFALLLPDAAELGPPLVGRLEETASEIFGPVASDLRIRVGLARCPMDGVTAADLMGRAQARQNGKEIVAP